MDNIKIIHLLKNWI